MNNIGEENRSNKCLFINKNKGYGGRGWGKMRKNVALTISLEDRVELNGCRKQDSNVLSP